MNANKIIALILIFIGIIIRFVVVIHNANIVEFNFFSIVIPLDFLISIFGIFLFLLYNRIPKKNIWEYLKIYERFKKDK